MKIYNTLTRKKQEFKPIKNGKVLMYHCGPTVYWTQHLGNMRAVVMADLVMRTFKYLDYKVTLVRNYTDVGHLTSDSDEGEDKIEKSAREEKLSPKQIADKYTKIFDKDIKLLNTLPATYKPQATECIRDMIKMVEILLDKKFAYTTDLAVYFDISKAKNYTALSGQKMDEKLKDAGQAEVSDANKKNPADFALWFFKAGKHKNALQYWKSPFKSKLVENGEGFPGWHLECSVMANKYLGPTIDVHMGGVEHIGVHHTNEIAQSEAANGVKFVNYWLHNEHLLVDNKKMSKSAGTGYSLQQVIDKGYDPLAVRYFFLQAHYKSKQNFTWKALEASQTALDKLYSFIQNQPAKDPDIPAGAKNRIHERNLNLIKEYKKQFKYYISEDFVIPGGLGLVWEIVKDRLLPYSEKKKLILDFDKVLGLNLKQVKLEKIKIPKEVEELVRQREKARQEKNWGLADKLRNKMAKSGYEVEDTPDGPKIIKKNKL